MALSAAAHHSFDKVAAGEKYDGLRAQKTDRAGEAAHRAPRRQRPRAALEPELFQLFEEEFGGARPAPLPEVAGWQERVQRHAVEHLGGLAPMVQIFPDRARSCASVHGHSSSSEVSAHQMPPDALSRHASLAR